MTDTPASERGKKLYLKHTKAGEKVTTNPGLWARITGQAVALKGLRKQEVMLNLCLRVTAHDPGNNVAASRGMPALSNATHEHLYLPNKSLRADRIAASLADMKAGRNTHHQMLAKQAVRKTKAAMKALQQQPGSSISPEDAANALGDAYHQSEAKAALDGVLTTISQSSHSLKSISNAVTEPKAKGLGTKHQRAIAELKLSTLGQVRLCDLGFEDFEQDNASTRKTSGAVKGAKHLARIIGAADNALAEVNSACEWMTNYASKRADDLDGFQDVCKSAVARMEGQIQHLMTVAQALMTIGERVPDMPDSLCQDLAFHGAQLLNLATQLANDAGPFGMSYRIAKLGATDPQAAIDTIHRALEPQAASKAIEAAGNDAEKIEEMDAPDALTKAPRASADGPAVGVRRAAASVGNELGSVSGFSWKSPLQKSIDELDSPAQESGIDPDTVTDALHTMLTEPHNALKGSADLNYLNEPLQSASGITWAKRAQDQAATVLHGLQSPAESISTTSSANNHAIDPATATATEDPSRASLRERFVDLVAEIDAVRKDLSKPLG